MKSYKYTFYDSREDVIEGYLMNSPKVVAEMLYDTIDRYEKELKKGQENYNKLWDLYSELKRENKVLQEYINETKDCGSCKIQRAIKTYDKRKNK